MRLVDPRPDFKGSKRQIPNAIRVSPEIANRLCSRLAKTTPTQAEIIGLLFGAVESDLVTLLTFRSFQADTENLSSKEQLQQMFQHLRTTAHNDPEVSGLELVGWFGLRLRGGLTDSDVQFHNERFKRAGDVAVIVRPEQEPNALFEFYSRVDERVLSAEDYRWASFRIDSAQEVAGAIEVSLRPKPGLLLQQFEPIERSKEALDHTRQIARAIVDRTLARGVQAGASTGLPAVRKEKKRVPWMSSAVIFAVAAFITFASFYIRAAQSRREAPLFLQALFPSTSLELRAEGQGDRVLLSWNRRNPVVRTAKGGLLRIDDGSQHREVHLDPAQVGNGGVLYRPGSDDVMFRLEVYGQQGATLAESMRVLDGDKTRRPEGQNAPMDLSGPVDLNNVKPAKSGSTTDAKNQAARTPRLDQNQDFLGPGATPASAFRGSDKSGGSVHGESGAGPPATTAETRSATQDVTKSSSDATKAPSTETASIPGSAPELGSASKADPSSNQSRTTPSTPSPLQPALSGPVNRLPLKPSDTNPLATAPSGTPATTAGSQPSDAITSNPHVAPAFVPPRPIRQILPNIRYLGAGAIRTTPQVEVTVKVNKKGRVVEATIVNNGTQMKKAMAQAAASAAKQWTFQPATINGQTVESYHTIVFEFRPESR